MLPEDDRMIETCRSVLSVLCKFYIIKDYICAFVGAYLNKLQNARCKDKDSYSQIT